MKDIITAGFCEVGNKREKNQDAYLMHTGWTYVGLSGLFLVADGVGGLEWGEEASRKAVESLDDWWRNHLSVNLKHMDYSSMKGIKLFSQELLNRVKRLHYNLIQQAKKEEIQMGTTFSMLFLANKEYCIVHIGDSRIYKTGFWHLNQLTSDHNFSTNEYKAGKISKKQWEDYKGKDPLLQCIGAGETIEPQVIVGKIRRGDKFFLCSDGVYKFIHRKELARLVKGAHKEKPEDSMEKIREIVYDNGAADNLTAVLVCCV